MKNCDFLRKSTPSNDKTRNSSLTDINTGAMPTLKENNQLMEVVNPAAYLQEKKIANMPGLSNYQLKEASNMEISNEAKPPTAIDNIFKLQFMNDGELEILKDSANEYKHTHNMNASEKVSYEMSILPMLDLS